MGPNARNGQKNYRKAGQDRQEARHEPERGGSNENERDGAGVGLGEENSGLPACMSAFLQLPDRISKTFITIPFAIKSSNNEFGCQFMGCGKLTMPTDRGEARELELEWLDLT